MQAPRVSAFLISVGQMRHHTPSLCNTITRPLLTHEREEGGIKKYGKRSTFLSQSAPFFLLTSPPHFFWPKLPSPSLIFCCPGCPCAYIRQKVCKVSVQPKLRKKRYSLDVLYWWHHHHFNPEARARKNLYLYPVAAQLPFLYRYIHVQNNSTSFFTCKNNKLNCDLLIKNDNKKSTIKDLMQQPFWKSK